MSTLQVTSEAAGGQPRTSGRRQVRGARSGPDVRGAALLTAAVVGLLLVLALPAPAWITTAGLVACAVAAAVGWEWAIGGAPSRHHRQPGGERLEEIRELPEH